jgi:hypothetical protein
MYKAAMRKHSRWTALSLVAWLALAGPAAACSFYFPVRAFVPVPADQQRSDEAFPGTLPAVEVEVGRVDRTSSLEACSVYAEVDLILRWASPTDVRWEDVGVYLQAGDGATPEMPIRADIVDGVAHLQLHVFDTRPADALDVEYEIRIVDNALRLGPVSRFHVRFAARPTEPYDAVLALRARLLASGRASDASSYLSETLRDLVESGPAQFAPCGLYSPFGCGEAETALLARGDVRIGSRTDIETLPASCVGVRQASGRVVRMVFAKGAWSETLAAAEWVEGADARDWTRVAEGCGALVAQVSSQETAQVEVARAKYEAQRKRIQEREAADPCGACKDGKAP